MKAVKESTVIWRNNAFSGEIVHCLDLLKCTRLSMLQMEVRLLSFDKQLRIKINIDSPDIACVVILDFSNTNNAGVASVLVSACV